jgi:hypothetical protein
MVKIVRIPTPLIFLWALTASFIMFEITMTSLDASFALPEPSAWQLIKRTCAITFHSITLHIALWISLLPTIAWGLWTIRRKNLRVPENA